jgi:hypothetical protein
MAVTEYSNLVTISGIPKGTDLAGILEDQLRIIDTETGSRRIDRTVDPEMGNYQENSRKESPSAPQHYTALGRQRKRSVGKSVTIYGNSYHNETRTHGQ